MPLAMHPELSETKAVFARNLDGLKVSDGCVVFNAPRPLLGAKNAYTEWCHGRFYVEINLTDNLASALIQKNNDLDARVVLAVTDAEVVEMLLMDNAHADAYRECTFEDQKKILLPQIGRIQSLPYPQAIALLEAAQAVLAADE